MAGGSKFFKRNYFPPQYLKLRPPVPCDFEAKQLGPQFYWSFFFVAVLSLLCSHNNFVSLKALRKTQ
jgi:hypothetical protein